MGHQVEPLVERRLRQPGDRHRGLPRGVVRDEHLPVSRFLTSSTPQKQPSPRTSPIDGCPAARPRSESPRYPPTSAASTTPFSERLDRGHRGRTREGMPGVRQPAGEELTPHRVDDLPARDHRADGTYPELIPFATVMMSGTTSQCSQANQRPVLPNPAITSSRMSRIPWRSQTSRIARR